MNIPGTKIKCTKCPFTEIVTKGIQRYKNVDYPVPGTNQIFATYSSIHTAQYEYRTGRYCSTCNQTNTIRSFMSCRSLKFYYHNI